MYRTPLLDLKAQYKTIKRDVNRAIQNVLDEQSFILGKDVDMLEKEFNIEINFSDLDPAEFITLKGLVFQCAKLLCSKNGKIIKNG